MRTTRKNLTEMEPKQWHWQERLAVTTAPDEACRSQMHQVHQRIPYDVWLAQKRKAAANMTALNGEENGEEAEKQAKSEAAFREWCARKNREIRQKKERIQDQQATKVSNVAGKPPSQHVNPKVKRKGAAAPLSPAKKQADEEQAAAAYASWLARVKKEDRVRRARRRQERKTRAQQNREAHDSKWKKKLVVCAYSTAAAT